jgi:predicted nucleic acid-binding protein
MATMTLNVPDALEKEHDETVQLITEKLYEAGKLSLGQSAEMCGMRNCLEARKLSIKLGLSIIGTSGLLLLAKQEGYISAVKPFLELMKQTDFRVSDDLYQTVLRKAGEV